MDFRVCSLELEQPIPGEHGTTEPKLTVGRAGCCATRHPPSHVMSKPTITELPSLDALKKDAIALGQEAAQVARERVLRPAQELVRDSREHMDAAGERLKDEAADAETALRVQRDRAADWISAHPFAAVGLAVGAGVLLSELLRDRR